MNSLLFIATIWPMIGILLVVCLVKNDQLRFDLSSCVMFIEMAFMLYLIFEAMNGKTYDFELNGFCGMGIHLSLDGFRALYGTIAVFMWLMTTLFTKEYLQHYENKARYLFFTLVTCGATTGVFLSANLFTTFIYFEIMSFTSYVMVIHEQTEGALKAGDTYIAVAVSGGMIMLMGLFLLYWKINTLEMNQLYALCSAVEDKRIIFIAGVLILIGFGAKAGLYPLHIWLPKAHPVAPAPASALLSGILTKAGVFGMLVTTTEIFRENEQWGYLILVLGVITMLLGAILAIFSNNLKRTLACSSMSQIGFISVGLAMSVFLGEENALAVRGTILHMVNHSLIKLLLFMIAGVVYMNFHQLDLNKIKGFGKKHVWLMVLYLAGALGISGVPLFNGYISKTLIHESILEYVEMMEGTSAASLFHIVEILFVIAGGLTFAYMTKLFVCLFIETNDDAAIQKKFDEMNIWNMQSKITLTICAIPLLAIGMVPNIVADGIADFSQSFMHASALEESIHYFSFANIKGGAISLAIGAFVYVFFIRTWLMKNENGKHVYVDRWISWLDLEKLFYRPVIMDALVFMGAFAARFTGSLTEWLLVLLNKTILRQRPIKPRNEHDYKPGTLVSQIRTPYLVDEIEGSLSFGLLLFGMGICFALIYILVIAR